MIPRILQKQIRKLAAKMPVITITGPRQSGKTTLAKMALPDYAYKNLEFPDVRRFATEDPRGFFGELTQGVILDEIQRVPELLSYVQGIVDETNEPGKFILTGSQNLLLLNKVSQTLAGRSAILHLLPLSMEELIASGAPEGSAESWMQRGFYPRLYDKKISPLDWLPSYVESYVERDVREIINVRNLSTFQTFLRLCAGRIGQVVNLSSLGNDCGVDQKTAKGWISVLETTFTAFLLPPFHRNFNKRLIKSPKIYFYDTGLACWLLGIRSVKDLDSHYARGSLFENFIIVELMKNEMNRGRRTELYFWRESNGNEVDCVYEKNGRVFGLECKSGKTIGPDYFNGIDALKKISGKLFAGGTVIYGGTEIQRRSNATVLPWTKTADFLVNGNTSRRGAT
jgi:uncharacterized protein